MKKILVLLFTLLPLALFGAGATVSTVNGVATNLTVVGAMGPQSGVNHATNADVATLALTANSAATAAMATIAVTANSALAANLATQAVFAVSAGTATAATTATTAATAVTSVGLTIGSSATASFVVGYASDGVTLVTNILTNGISGGGSIPTNYVFTSSTCVDDAVLNLGSTTYGTDNYTNLQAILNKATNNAPLHVYWNGHYSIGLSSKPLRIRSNTEIEFAEGCGVILRSNSNCEVFQNFDLTNGLVTSNIWMHGGIINGNAPRNSGIETNTTDTWLFCNLFSGCYNFKWTEMTIYDNVHFGVLLQNFTNAFFNNNYVSQSLTAGVVSPDGLHFFGPMLNLYVNNTTCSNLTDDAVGVGIDEKVGGGTFSDHPVWHTAGYGKNVTVLNTIAMDCNSGVRILSVTNRLDSVVVRGIHGTVGAYAMTVSPNWAGFPGNVGNIDFSEIDCKLASFGDLSGQNNATLGANPCWQIIGLNGRIDNVRGSLFVSDFGDARPPIFLASTSNIGNLRLDLMINDSTNLWETNLQGKIEINTNAVVDNLDLNVLWKKPSGTNIFPFGNLVRVKGSNAVVNHYKVSGLVTNAACLALMTNGGSFGEIQIGNLIFLNGGYGPTVQAGGNTLTIGSYHGPAPTNSVYNWSNYAAIVYEPLTDLNPDYFWLKASSVSGNTWTDLTGNGRNFKLVASPSVGSGYIAFNGTTQYATNASIATANFTSQDFSYSVWINMTNVTTQSLQWLFGTENFNVNGYAISWFTNGASFIRFNQAANSQTSSSSGGGFSFNNWFNVVITRSGATVKTYLNGADVSSSVAMTNPVANTTHFPDIAAYGPAPLSPFGGLMSDIRMYSYTLTPTQVTNNVYLPSVATHGKP